MFFELPYKKTIIFIVKKNILFVISPIVNMIDFTWFQLNNFNGSLKDIFQIKAIMYCLRNNGETLIK